MLTSEQKKWIDHLSDVEKIKIIPYNPEIVVVFDKMKILNKKKRSCYSTHSETSL